MEVVCCDFELAIDLFDFGLCITDVIFENELMLTLALLLRHEKYILQGNKNAFSD